MASSLFLLLFLSLLSLLSSSSSDNSTLKLSLTPFFKEHIAEAESQSESAYDPSETEANRSYDKRGLNHPWLKTLSYLTSSSLARAHQLKHPKENPSSSLSQVPLSPKSYGGYSISLSFGSPAQTLPFVMDTGSSLVWFPCTHRYRCSDCGFSDVNPANISIFIPKLSSTAKILGCKNKKCGWVFGSENPIQCKANEICPAYMLQYGSGSTSGLLLSETLDFPEGDVNEFIVGCSILSSRQPSGIAGFGRGPASLPAQMGLKKFSYCLVSHRFDDTPVSSELVLVRESANSGDNGISYTKFQKNPMTSRSAFQDYYYLNLRKITVGGVRVKIPYSFLVPGADGGGGTIIDSGTTFTFMDGHIHNLVAKEFEKQMSKYKRAADVEKQTGLRPCFDISGRFRSNKTVEFPDLVFHFKGGAKLSLPLADYFSFLGDAGVVCMTIVSSNVVGPDIKSGPSIIFGNYQQQNIYLEYDLKNERLGFKKQVCK